MDTERKISKFIEKIYRTIIVFVQYSMKESTDEDENADTYQSRILMSSTLNING